MAGFSKQKKLFTFDPTDESDYITIENAYLKIRQAFPQKAKTMLTLLDKTAEKVKIRNVVKHPKSIYDLEKLGLVEGSTFIRYKNIDKSKVTVDSYVEKVHNKEQVVYIKAGNAYSGGIPFLPYVFGRPNQRLAFNWWGDPFPTISKSEADSWINQ